MTSVSQLSPFHPWSLQNLKRTLLLWQKKEDLTITHDCRPVSGQTQVKKKTTQSPQKAQRNSEVKTEEKKLEKRWGGRERRAVDVWWMELEIVLPMFHKHRAFWNQPMCFLSRRSLWGGPRHVWDVSQRRWSVHTDPTCYMQVLPKVKDEIYIHTKIHWTRKMFFLFRPITDRTEIKN